MISSVQMKYHSTFSTIVISLAVLLVFSAVALAVVTVLSMTSPTLIATNEILDGLSSADTPLTVSFESIDRNFRDGVFINGLNIGYEGEDVALRFNELGFHAFVVDYRCGRDAYPFPAPVEDALRAIKLVRGHAEEWKVRPDQIATLGFSAGGHLCCATAVWFDSVAAESQKSMPVAERLHHPTDMEFAPPLHQESAEHRSAVRSGSAPSFLRRACHTRHPSRLPLAHRCGCRGPL